MSITALRIRSLCARQHMSESSVAPSLQQTEKDGGVHFACVAVHFTDHRVAKYLCEPRGFPANRALNRTCVVDTDLLSGADGLAVYPRAQLGGARWYLEGLRLNRRCEEYYHGNTQRGHTPGEHKMSTAGWPRRVNFVALLRVEDGISSNGRFHLFSALSLRMVRCHAMSRAARRKGSGRTRRR